MERKRHNGGQMHNMPTPDEAGVTLGVRETLRPLLLEEVANTADLSLSRKDRARFGYTKGSLSGAFKPLKSFGTTTTTTTQQREDALRAAFIGLQGHPVPVPHMHPKVREAMQDRRSRLSALLSAQVALDLSDARMRAGINRSSVATVTAGEVASERILGGFGLYAGDQVPVIQVPSGSAVSGDLGRYAHIKTLRFTACIGEQVGGRGQFKPIAVSAINVNVDALEVIANHMRPESFYHAKRLGGCGAPSFGADVVRANGMRCPECGDRMTLDHGQQAVFNLPHVFADHADDITQSDGVVLRTIKVRGHGDMMHFTSVRLPKATMKAVRRTLWDDSPEAQRRAMEHLMAPNGVDVRKPKGRGWMRATLRPVYFDGTGGASDLGLAVIAPGALSTRKEVNIF